MTYHPSVISVTNPLSFVSLLKENDTNHLRAILHTELIYFSFRFKFTYFFCFMQNKNMLIFTNLHTLFFYVQRISFFFAHFFGFYARTV